MSKPPGRRASSENPRRSAFGANPTCHAPHRQPRPHCRADRRAGRRTTHSRERGGASPWAPAAWRTIAPRREAALAKPGEPRPTPRSSQAMDGLATGRHDPIRPQIRPKSQLAPHRPSNYHMTKTQTTRCADGLPVRLPTPSENMRTCAATQHRPSSPRSRRRLMASPPNGCKSEGRPHWPRREPRGHPAHRGLSVRSRRPGGRARRWLTDDSRAQPPDQALDRRPLARFRLEP